MDTALGRSIAQAGRAAVALSGPDQQRAPATQREEPPHITITAVSLPSGARFWVCDNGFGIPVDKREEVFMMFRRLHVRSSVEGIGLANCRKVAELHGGEIREIDAPGRGACFVFDITDR